MASRTAQKPPSPTCQLAIALSEALHRAEHKLLEWLTSPWSKLARVILYQAYSCCRCCLCRYRKNFGSRLVNSTSHSLLAQIYYYTRKRFPPSSSKGCREAPGATYIYATPSNVTLIAKDWKKANPSTRS